jgi:hypothetical protein
MMSRNWVFASLLVFFLLAFSACSVLETVRSPSSSYRSFVDRRVAVAKIFDRGRELVSAKALLADEALKSRQESLTPGFHFPFDASKDQVIVALDLSTWERFSQDDLRFYLEGISSDRVRELTNPTETEMHYPFAHPHYRIFCVNFPKSAAREVSELTIHTLRGELKLRLKP